MAIAKRSSREVMENGFLSWSALLGLSLAALFASIMAFSWFKGNQFPVEGRTAIITGGSQGLGLSAACLLSSKGANVVIVARTQSKLDAAIGAIASAAKDSARQRFHAIAADTTSSKENARIMAETIVWNNGKVPDIVWANAGMAVPTLFLDSSIETMRSMMDINFWAAASLARETLKVWLLPRSGDASPEEASQSEKKSPTSSQKLLPRHFIMTCSVASLVGVAGYTPYAPGKAAMRSLHDNLRSELHMYHGAFAAERKRRVQTGQPTQDIPADVHIHTVMAGTIASPGLENENKTKHPLTRLLEETDPVETPDNAAAAAIAGLEKGRRFVSTQGYLGDALMGAAWGGSVRDQPVWNTFISWIINVAWLGIGWDMRRTAWNYGVKEGIPKHEGLR